MTLQEKLEKSLSVALAMRGMKQKDLALKMSCTAVYISNLMKDGKLSVSKLDSVAAALDFTLWEFARLGEQ